MSKNSHIVIVGNGISGITCARHVRRLNTEVQISVISSETEHFFSRTALMYIYMGHMKYEHTKPYEDFIWKKERITLCYDHVERLDVSKKQLVLRESGSMTYDQLVLATGSKVRTSNWPGISLQGIQGLFSYPDLRKMETATKNISKAAVVGGGLIGIELVEMLHSRHISTTFLIRDKAFWGNVLPKQEAELVTRHIREQKGVTLMTETEVKSFEDNGNGQLQSITCTNGAHVACEFAGISIGVQSNCALVEGTPVEHRRGILVDTYLRTSAPDVYAIGDCAELRQPAPHRAPIEAVWYAGRMMGETLARTLTGDPTPYHPGVWFNSAKFFDIEYQVYGQVSPKLLQTQKSLYWEHPKGRSAMRIVFDPSTHAVLGCNVLGFRQRHVAWERWIEQQIPIEQVLDALEEARFDAEFSYRYEDALRQSFKQEHQLSSVTNT